VPRASSDRIIARIGVMRDSAGDEDRARRALASSANAFVGARGA
jgi:hypothetical protein